MRQARWLILIFGILMPYLARLPGIPEHGIGWLLSYFGSGIFAILFFQAFNMILVGVVWLFTRNLKQPLLALWPAVLGYALPFYFHATLDLAADAQAAIALIFIPIFGIPGAALGYGIATWQQKRADQEN